MPQWFEELSLVENPGIEDLQHFVDELKEFFGTILGDQENFAFLWEDDAELHELALETFHGDVAEGTVLLRQAIPRIESESLASHGLVGRPLRFKLRVLAGVAGGWKRLRGHLNVREWFKRICDAIDAVLDSLIQAAGGVGGVIKEFKDALSALVKTV
jgi:hypothetical protein